MKPDLQRIIDEVWDVMRVPINLAEAEAIWLAAVPKPCKHGNTGRHVRPGHLYMASIGAASAFCDGKPEADPEVIGFTPRELWATCCPMDPECDHSMLSNEELSEWMDHELTRDEIMDLI